MKPKSSTDPHQAQSAADPAASTDDAAEDQATQIAAKTATFVALSLRSEAPEVLEAVMPTDRRHVARANPRLFDLDSGRLGVQVKGWSARLVPIRKLYVDLAHAVLEAQVTGRSALTQTTLP